MHEHGTHKESSHADAKNFIVTSMDMWYTLHFHIVTIETEALVAL
jgi:hypothetical protein